MMGMALLSTNAQPCFCDDPNATVVGAPGTTTYLTLAIANQDLLPMPQAMTTPQNVCIQGTLNINLPDYHFNTSFLNMGPNAAIQILSSNTLVIENTSLYGCQDMWQGMTIKPGGRLDVASSNIRDADIGILARFNTTLTAIGNTFENNRVGIRAIRPILNFIPGINVPLPISGNTFRTNGNLLSGGLGFAGIELSRVTGFTIGTTNGAASPNVFDNLENGIVANQSFFAVHGATFSNITEEDESSGILMRRFSRGLFVNNTFTNCNHALNSISSAAITFRENTLTDIRRRGLFINSEPDANNLGNITIENNNINTRSNGFQTQGVFIQDVSSLSITNNAITIGGPLSTFLEGTGIFISSGFSEANPGRVADNTINAHNGSIGVHWGTGDFTITENNTITIHAPVAGLPNAANFSEGISQGTNDHAVTIGNSILGYVLPPMHLPTGSIQYLVMSWIFAAIRSILPAGDSIFLEQVPSGIFPRPPSAPMTSA